MTEDKARERVESGDSGRERNAVIRPQEPAVARMVFFNGLLSKNKPGTAYSEYHLMIVLCNNTL